MDAAPMRSDIVLLFLSAFALFSGSPALALAEQQQPEITEPALPRDNTPVKVNIGMRIGARFQNRSRPHQLNGAILDTAYVETRFTGQLDRWFSWAAGFNASVPGFEAWDQNPPRVMDLTLRFQPHHAFNVWAGRLIVPADRTQLTGPFYISDWNYPGYFPGGWVGPKAGATGRDNGAVIWGQVLDARLKYYAGVFNMIPATTAQTTNHLYVSRLSFSLIGSEPGFYQTATNFGERSLLSVGAAIQYQSHGSGVATEQRDLFIAMADVLGEIDVDAVGTFTAQGTYYQFDRGQLVRGALSASVSYLTPWEVGIGRIQPLVRVQTTQQPNWTIVDALVNYVIHGFDLRVALNYQRTYVGAPRPAHAIALGVTIQH